MPEKPVGFKQLAEQLLVKYYIGIGDKALGVISIFPPFEESVKIEFIIKERVRMTSF